MNWADGWKAGAEGTKEEAVGLNSPVDTLNGAEGVCETVWLLKSLGMGLRDSDEVEQQKEWSPLTVDLRSE